MSQFDQNDADYQAEIEDEAYTLRSLATELALDSKTNLLDNKGRIRQVLV